MQLTRRKDVGSSGTGGDIIITVLKTDTGLPATDAELVHTNVESIQYHRENGGSITSVTPSGTSGDGYCRAYSPGSIDGSGGLQITIPSAAWTTRSIVKIIVKFTSASNLANYGPNIGYVECRPDLLLSGTGEVNVNSINSTGLALITGEVWEHNNSTAVNVGTMRHSLVNAQSDAASTMMNTVMGSFDNFPVDSFGRTIFNISSNIDTSISDGVVDNTVGRFNSIDSSIASLATTLGDLNNFDPSSTDVTLSASTVGLIGTDAASKVLTTPANTLNVNASGEAATSSSVSVDFTPVTNAITSSDQLLIAEARKIQSMISKNAVKGVYNIAPFARALIRSKNKRVLTMFAGDSNTLFASTSGHYKGLTQALINNIGPMYSTGTKPCHANGGWAASMNGIDAGAIPGFSSSASPPAAFDTKILNSSLATEDYADYPFVWIAEGDTVPSATVWNVLDIVQSSIVGDISDAMTWKVRVGNLASGTGSAWRAGIRERNTLNYIVQDSTQDSVTGTDELTTYELSMAADGSRSSMAGLQFVLHPVAQQDLTGPFYATFNEVVFDDRTTGLSTTLFAYQGGQSCYDLCNSLKNTNIAAMEEYFSFALDSQGAGDKDLMFVLVHGGNDRTETSPSWNPTTQAFTGPASNTPEGFANNVEGVKNYVIDAWLSLGHDIQNLSFMLGPYHPQSGYDTIDSVSMLKVDINEDYFDECISRGWADTTIVKGTELVTIDQATASSEYDVGGDAHLTDAGYVGHWDRAIKACKNAAELYDEYMYTIGTDAASKVLVTPSQKVVTNESGYVTTSNPATGGSAVTDETVAAAVATAVMADTGVKLTNADLSTAETGISDLATQLTNNTSTVTGAISGLVNFDPATTDVSIVGADITSIVDLISADNTTNTDTLSTAINAVKAVVDLIKANNDNMTPTRAAKLDLLDKAISELNDFDVSTEKVTPIDVDGKTYADSQTESQAVLAGNVVKVGLTGFKYLKGDDSTTAIEFVKGAHDGTRTKV